MLASMATDTSQGLTIALVHMLFNLTGVLIFYPFAPLRRLPVNAARMLALRAQHNVLYLVAYVVGVFVVLPLLGYIVFKGPGS
jgi:sodium-dependent phosphate cotransporter